MVRLFFKYNPFKLLFVFFILIGIRLIAYWSGLPMTDSEITWLCVGQRMSEGFTLYKDIWTELEPFSAAIYYILHLIAGKTTLSYFILSIALVFLQSVIFNLGLNKNKVFREPTALPALFYVLFSSLFFDFYTLSPVLMGMTFILLAFNIICAQSRITTREDRFLYIGLLTGIASLFYTPFVFFLLFSILALGLYSVTNFKKQMIMILAFFFPYIILLLYYFWIDNLYAYYRCSIQSIVNTAPELLIDLPTIIKITVLPLLILLIAGTAIGSRGRYIHYQYKIIKMAGLWLIISAAALLLEKTIAPHYFIMFVPPLAFFSAHLFGLFAKSKIMAELFFIILFAGIFTISFYSLKKPDRYTLTHLIRTVPEETTKLGIENSSLLVLGDDKSYYIDNRLSGPYLDWKLSSWQFEDFTQYENVSEIYETFKINQPDYIVDKDKKMYAIFEAIPIMKNQYERIDSSLIYRRKN